MEKEKLTKSGVRVILAPFIWTIVLAGIFFVAAGHMRVFRAWLYFGLLLAATLVNTYIFVKVVPELANRRGEAKPGTKGWDKVFLAVYFPLTLIVAPVIVGLDTGRFSWSGQVLQSGYFILLGVLLLIAGTVMTFWAMVVNRHFEGTVRIQEEQGHRVCRCGPYSMVRHPGYVGILLGNLAFPLILGSLWGFVPVAVAAVMLFFRTYFEDRMLREELDGYLQYAEEVKYRLLPGIW